MTFRRLYHIGNPALPVVATSTCLAMPRNHSSVYVLLAAIVLGASTVHAQAAKPDTTRPLKATAGVAFLDASGNTDITTLSINERLEWKRPHFLWTQSINGINSTTDGEESARTSRSASSICRTSSKTRTIA